MENIRIESLSAYVFMVSRYVHQRDPDRNTMKLIPKCTKYRLMCDTTVSLCSFNWTQWDKNAYVCMVYGLGYVIYTTIELEMHTPHANTMKEFRLFGKRIIFPFMVSYSYIPFSSVLPRRDRRKELHSENPTKILMFAFIQVKYIQSQKEKCCIDSFHSFHCNNLYS